jgi:hypothetical protein
MAAGGRIELLANPTRRLRGCGMALLWISGFDVKRGEEEAFQAWLAENEEELRRTAPAGIEYLGTYLVLVGTEKGTGEYRELYRLQSWAAFDALKEAQRDPNNAWGRLSREASTQFVDTRLDANNSALLLDELRDFPLWDLPG